MNNTIQFQQDFGKAWSDLEEAQDIIDRCGMRLYAVDSALLRGNLILDIHSYSRLDIHSYSRDSSRHSRESGNPLDSRLRGSDSTKNRRDSVEKEYKIAKALIETTGYHLRGGELEKLRIRLQ